MKKFWFILKISGLRSKHFVFQKFSGFTLIEVLVVATIIGVLAMVAVTSYASVNKRSRDAKRKSDIEQLRSAIEMYRSDQGYYPAVGTGGSFVPVSNLISNLVTAYMPAVPSDPQSPTQDYYYQAISPIGTPVNYYGYCLCAKLETQTTITSSCTSITLPAECNYGVKSP